MSLRIANLYKTIVDIAILERGGRAFAKNVRERTQGKSYSLPHITA